MHSAVEEIWYEGERLAANHARGHNLIHPEVAGGPPDVSNPKAFSVLQDSVWGDFLFVILFLFHQLQIAVWVSDLSDRWFSKPARYRQLPVYPSPGLARPAGSLITSVFRSHRTNARFLEKLIRSIVGNSGNKVCCT